MRDVTDMYFNPHPHHITGQAMGKLHLLAEKLNMDIVLHIEQKMTYNSSRPIRHGK